jgi:hypothetical protein
VSYVHPPFPSTHIVCICTSVPEYRERKVYWIKRHQENNYHNATILKKYSRKQVYRGKSSQFLEKFSKNSMIISIFKEKTII